MRGDVTIRSRIAPRLRCFILIFVIAALVGLTAPLFAQTDDAAQPGIWPPFDATQLGKLPPNTPSWVYYQEGQKLFDEGEFGKALVSYRRALETQPEKKFPEAEMGIGMVFAREGETKLAVDHLSRAIAQRQLFYIPQDYYTALYELAGIYKLQQNYRDYENMLVSIVEDDERFSNPDLAMSRPAYRNTLEQDGLDKLVLLYRLPDDFSLTAHLDLGIFYVSTGKYSDAADNLLFSTLKIISEAISAYLQIEPDFEFSTMNDFLNRARGIPEIENYLTTRQLYQSLYFLAAAIYGQNFTERARAVWQLVASRSEAGAWQGRARARVLHPRLEPQLDTNR
ncbi:MAG TPA: hypothetical protein VMW87_12205 [Spirochaetia bacterium]|nr:hypothetical protein [Spirochaetia bacterium]